MKTTKEILDFYGVEIGKKYIITKGYAPFNKGDTFEIEENSNNYHEQHAYLKHKDILWGKQGIHFLTFLEYEEVKVVKPEILTDKDKEYLSTVIKPFRDNVECVSKQIVAQSKKECIQIRLYNDDYFALAFFEPNEMYKGMERYKWYTLEELGL